MKEFLYTLLILSLPFSGLGQTYTETIDTFYVPTPEYSVSLSLDTLWFPCAVTTPDVGSSFPVLILVHGTTSLDMDANSTKDFKDSIGASFRKAQTHLFYDIADSLSRNGIIVLRYDKRSYTVNCIEKPACWWADTITPYDYIRDVNYAVDFAKTIPGVDTCNIFLAGHSQGGSFVGDVGNKRSDIRGVIAMAPTAQPIDTVAVFQTITVDSDPVGAVIFRNQFDSLRAGTWPMNDTLYKKHFSPRFWLDWIAITDSAVITQQNSSARTLFMYGTEDAFVPPSTHMSIWTDSIVRPNVTFQTYPLLDHSFGTIYDSTMNISALQGMSDWILGNLVSCTGSLDEMNQDGIFIYPNPAKQQLNIAISTNDQVTTISMHDLSGRLVKMISSTKGNHFSIDVSAFAPGTYVIGIETANSMRSKKVVIE
ncbi:MAG: dienelactone hydrolase [Crocinitomicaceae bacterium]|jgi:dienelactone hydrolase